MSIRTSIFYLRIWKWPDVRLHAFRSMHDGRVYVTAEDVQIWPPSRAMNLKTGKIGRWRWDRFYYHDPKPTTECNCWRCTIIEKRSHE